MYYMKGMKEARRREMDLRREYGILNTPWSIDWPNYVGARKLRNKKQATLDKIPTWLLWTQRWFLMRDIEQLNSILGTYYSKYDHDILRKYFDEYSDENTCPPEPDRMMGFTYAQESNGSDPEQDDAILEYEPIVAQPEEPMPAEPEEVQEKAEPTEEKTEEKKEGKQHEEQQFDLRLVPPTGEAASQPYDTDGAEAPAGKEDNPPAEAEAHPESDSDPGEQDVREEAETRDDNKTEPEPEHGESETSEGLPDDEQQTAVSESAPEKIPEGANTVAIPTAQEASVVEAPVNEPAPAETPIEDGGDYDQYGRIPSFEEILAHLDSDRR